VSIEVKFRIEVRPLREKIELYKFKGIEVEDKLKVRDFGLSFVSVFNITQSCPKFDFFVHQFFFNFIENPSFDTQHTQLKQTQKCSLHFSFFYC